MRKRGTGGMGANTPECTVACVEGWFDGVSTQRGTAGNSALAARAPRAADDGDAAAGAGGAAAKGGFVGSRQ